MNQDKRSIESGAASQETGRHRLARLATLALETLLFATVLGIEGLVFLYKPGVRWPRLLILGLILSTPLPWLMGIWISPRGWKQARTAEQRNQLLGYCRVGSAYLPLLISLLLLLSVGHA